VRLRQDQAKPILDDLESWLQTQLPRISGKSERNRGESPGGGVFPTLELAPTK
jgi:hypothetical protein